MSRSTLCFNASDIPCRCPEEFVIFLNTAVTGTHWTRPHLTCIECSPRTWASGASDRWRITTTVALVGTACSHVQEYKEGKSSIQPKSEEISRVVTVTLDICVAFQQFKALSWYFALIYRHTDWRRCNLSWGFSRHALGYNVVEEFRKCFQTVQAQETKISKWWGWRAIQETIICWLLAVGNFILFWIKTPFCATTPRGPASVLTLALNVEARYPCPASTIHQLILRGARPGPITPPPTTSQFLSPWLLPPPICFFLPIRGSISLTKMYLAYSRNTIYILPTECMYCRHLTLHPRYFLWRSHFSFFYQMNKRKPQRG